MNIRTFDAYSDSLPAPVRYVLASALVLVALGIRFFGLPVESGAQFVTFYPAVALSFYLAGAGPGVFALIVSALVGFYFFFPPYFTWEPRTESIHSTILFSLSSSLIAWVINRGHRYRARSVKFERNISKQTIETGKENLALAIDGARIAVWRWDILKNQVTLSDTGCFYFGLPVGARMISYEKFLSLMHPDDRDRVSNARAKNIEMRADFETEFRVIRPDGSERWLYSLGRPYALQNGIVEHVDGVVLDITHRKGMENELEAKTVEAEAKAKDLANMAESMPQIVWACDPSGATIYFNSQWTEYTGRSLEDSYGDQWVIPFHPDDREYAQQAWNFAVKNRLPYSLECRLRRSDGVYRWWLIRGVPAFDANGNIYKWFGTCTDIQAIKEGEEELRNSKTTLDAAINAMHEAVVICDATGGIIKYNGAAISFVRAKPGDVEPKSFKDIFDMFEMFTPEGSPMSEEERAIPRALRGKKGFSEAKYRRKATGEEWYGIYSYAPISNQDDKVIGAVATALDITERKKLEIELQELNVNLDAKVRERTDELFHLNQALSELARHDPLTGLYNRMAADEQLRSEFERMKRIQHAYSVLMIDIDLFKDVNDTYGHAVGDEVLKLLAHTMNKCLRVYDFIARFGGEEFLILLPHTDLDQACLVAEKVRAAVSELQHPVAGPITVSIGVAEASPDQTNEDVAVKEADDRLYEAKRAGRNRIVNASPSAGLDASQ